jgi:hypothetical protein
MDLLTKNSRNTGKPTIEIMIHNLYLHTDSYSRKDHLHDTQGRLFYLQI